MDGKRIQKKVAHQRDVKHLPLASLLVLLVAEEQERGEGGDDVHPLERDRQVAYGCHVGEVYVFRVPRREGGAATRGLKVIVN